MLASLRSSAFLLASLLAASLLAACADEGDDPGFLIPAAGKGGSASGGAGQGAGGQGVAGQAGAGGAAGAQAGSGGSAGEGQGGSAGAGAAGAGAAGETGQGGCGPLGGEEGCAGGPPEPAQLLYPTPQALFSKAIVPSCSLNQGQCHSGWAAPELTSFEALTSLFGAPCQTKAGNPFVVVNECEPPGDRLAFADGTERTVLAVIVPDGQPAVPSQVVVYLDGEPGAGAMALRQPDGAVRSMEAASLGEPDANGGRVLDLSALPGALANAWDVREWPRPPGGVLEADPNGDGVLGASLGWRQIAPGDPDRSFFYQRLLDDRLGTKMPLVQGLWTPEATRAVYCMILGQKQPSAPDPEQPIDYVHCPPDLTVTSGFAAVASIAKNKCAIPGCHAGAEPAEGLDLTPTPEQFAKVIAALSSQKGGAPLIKPGSRADSYLYCKVDPSCERAPDTDLMPKDLGALSPKELERLGEWIDQGAKLE